MSSPSVDDSCGSFRVTGTMQYWWYPRGHHEETVWVGVVGPLCTFCLFSLYLLQHLRVMVDVRLPFGIASPLK